MPKKVGTEMWRKKRRQGYLEMKEYRYYIIFLIKHPETSRSVFCCRKRLFSHFNVAETGLKSR